MELKEMNGVFSNEDLTVQCEPSDPNTPIMVDCDGWMELDEARELYEDLGEAIRKCEVGRIG